MKTREGGEREGERKTERERGGGTRHTHTDRKTNREGGEGRRSSVFCIANDT